MNVRFSSDRLALRCGIVTLGVSITRRWSDKAWNGKPYCKHFSIVLQTPWTYYRGFQFNPPRFGFHHDGSRAHLYLGLIYFNGDIGRRKPMRLATKRVGLISLAWSEPNFPAR
jgi:hypothetical protein